jgi:hypothetical protein
MPSSYTLRHRGTDLVIETSVARGEKQPNRARLLVGGVEVDSGCTDEVGRVELGTESGHPSRVTWWWTGRVSGCAFVEPGHGDVRRRSVPYAPPSGTRAARLHAWGEAHPNLYAARHVVINVGGTILAVLGVGALLRALIPVVDLDWLPDVGLGAPGWLRYLDPSRYLAPLFDWVAPLVDWLVGWIPDVDLGWWKYVAGFLFAVSIAVQETRRRKRVTGPRGPAGEDDTREDR